MRCRTRVSRRKWKENRKKDEKRRKWKKTSLFARVLRDATQGDLVPKVLAKMSHQFPVTVNDRTNKGSLSLPESECSPKKSNDPHLFIHIHMIMDSRWFASHSSSHKSDALKTSVDVTVRTVTVATSKTPTMRWIRKVGALCVRRWYYGDVKQNGDVDGVESFLCSWCASSQWPMVEEVEKEDGGPNGRDMQRYRIQCQWLYPNEPMPKRGGHFIDQNV